MNFTYEFTVNDDEVVARPTEDGKSPVTLDPAIAEIDDTTAGWEPLIKDIVSEHGEAFEGGRLTVPFDEAVEAVVAGNSDIQSQKRARATLEYLVSEGVLDADGDQLVVLLPLEEVQESNWSYGYNWAATLEGLQDRIEEAKERVDHVDSIEDIDPISDEIQQLVNELTHVSEECVRREQEIRSWISALKSFPDVELTDEMSALVSAVDAGEDIDPDEIQQIVAEMTDVSVDVQSQSRDQSQ